MIKLRENEMWEVIIVIPRMRYNNNTVCCHRMDKDSVFT